MTIGDRIKKLRKDRDMTQEELAKCIDSKKQTIYKYENNIVTNIPSDKIEKIAEALETTPSYLMGWDKVEQDYQHSTYLSSLYFDSLMKWSEDKFLKKHETTILREHMAELFIRYKRLIERFAYAQMDWQKTKDDFIKLHKQRQEPLSDIEIKELFLKQDLEKEIEDLVLWVRNFPVWIARNEGEYLKQAKDTPFGYSKEEYAEESNAMLNAAHEIYGASKEDKEHDENIMGSKDF